MMGVPRHLFSIASQAAPIFLSFLSASLASYFLLQNGAALLKLPLGTPIALWPFILTCASFLVAIACLFSDRLKSGALALVVLALLLFGFALLPLRPSDAASWKTGVLLLSLFLSACLAKRLGGNSATFVVPWGVILGAVFYFLTPSLAPENTSYAYWRALYACMAFFVLPLALASQKQLSFQSTKALGALPSFSLALLLGGAAEIASRLLLPFPEFWAAALCVGSIFTLFFRKPPSFQTILGFGLAFSIISAASFFLPSHTADILLTRHKEVAPLVKTLPNAEISSVLSTDKKTEVFLQNAIGRRMKFVAPETPRPAIEKANIFLILQPTAFLISPGSLTSYGEKTLQNGLLIVYAKGFEGAVVNATLRAGMTAAVKSPWVVIGPGRNLYSFRELGFTEQSDSSAFLSRFLNR